MITCYTIQHQEAALALLQGNPLTCPKQYADPSFERAYTWLTKQMMAKNMPPPQDNLAPLWTWIQYRNEKHPRPDLRESAHLPKGTPGTLITFRKDPQEILMSDVELWTYCLNNWFIPDHIDDINTTKTQEEIEASWQHIFNMDFAPQDITTPKPEKSIQANLWIIHPHEVIKTQDFIAR